MRWEYWTACLMLCSSVALFALAAIVDHRRGRIDAHDFYSGRWR